ncbi:hypothetical protein [Methylomonas koyamae]|nr:hypothetical protein [Methylomonas koyamae]
MLLAYVLVQIGGSHPGCQRRVRVDVEGVFVHGQVKLIGNGGIFL